MATNLFIVRKRVMPFGAAGPFYNIVHRRQVVAVADRAIALRIARMLQAAARTESVTRTCGHVERYPTLEANVRHTFWHTACASCRQRVIDAEFTEVD